MAGWLDVRPTSSELTPAARGARGRPSSARTQPAALPRRARRCWARRLLGHARCRAAAADGVGPARGDGAEAAGEQRAQHGGRGGGRRRLVARVLEPGEGGRTGPAPGRSGRRGSAGPGWPRQWPRPRARARWRRRCAGRAWRVRTRGREGTGGAWLRVRGEAGPEGRAATVPRHDGAAERKGPALRAAAAWLASGCCLAGLRGRLLARVARGTERWRGERPSLMRGDEDDAGARREGDTLAAASFVVRGDPGWKTPIAHTTWVAHRARVACAALLHFQAT